MADLEITAVVEYDPLEEMVVDGSGARVQITPVINLDPNDRIVIDLDADDTDLSDATVQNERPPLRQAHRRREPILQVLARHIQPHRAADPEEDPNYRTIPSIRHPKCLLRKGKFIQLEDKDFFEITFLGRHRHFGHKVIRGLRYRRNKYLGGMLERKTNEVCLLLCYDANDRCDVIAQSKECVELREIVKTRKLVKTNQAFPACSFREDPTNARQGKKWVEKHASLTCRWKFTEFEPNPKEHTSIERLLPEECDKVTAADELKTAHRGGSIKGGADPGITPMEEDFNAQEWALADLRDPLNFHTIPDDLPHLDQDGQLRRRYTLGDAFCCAGGTSRGAKGAGLRVEWGFDFDRDAIDSYRLNFHNVDAYAMAADHFIALIDQGFKIDILHLSPPCQTFSPAHTRLGQNDEMNQASFFAVQELVKRLKPRVVTLEETFGLARLVAHGPWFRALIHMLTTQGYSVRWKVFDLREFGLPQPRKRLFVFASCPGEPLPPFPAATHINPAQAHLHPNLKPWTSIYEAISSVPPDISLHNPLTVSAFQKTPYNGNAPLSSTITCNEGQSYHPSGSRAFTLREIACLQGFPLEHRFIDVAGVRGNRGKVRRQLGNAVPPMVAKIFFEEIIESLRKVDGVA